MNEMKKVVFLSGPPKAGKSRLRGDIYRELLSSGHRSWFVQAFSPDCEGQWVNDCHENGRGNEAESLARKAKNAVKEAGEFFSPRFVAAMQQQLKGLITAFDLVVADLGGIPSAENHAIVSVALFTPDVVVEAVTLMRNGDDGGWQAFWDELAVSNTVEVYHSGLAKKVIEN